MHKTVILFSLSVLLVSPVLAQEGVWLNVNQTHTLAWHWDNTEGPVRSFVFRCGQYVKEIVDADARSIQFRSLIDEPGRYSGCTLAAQNEAGLSAPVALPAFDYAYSYGALARFSLELAATIFTAVGVLAVSGRQALGWFRRRQPASPLALPEPFIILETAKERRHVHHDS